MSMFTRTQTLEVFNKPAAVEVFGKTKTERQLSVMVDASKYTKLALVDAKGKLGKAARAGLSGGGLYALAKQAAWPSCNYLPTGEYFAALMAEAVFISSRATFESLADQMEARIFKAKMGKNGGYVVDKKTGADKPGAALSMALELKATAVELIATATAITIANKAAHEAAKAPAIATNT